MDMGINMMNILKILLIVIGILTAGWGVYDLFSDNGAQTNNGVKKVIGGLAFAIIMGFAMSWAVGEVEKAASQAGMSGTSFSAVIEQPAPLPEALTVPYEFA